ncbi:MAG: baseplate J/gp47 family protein, partial [Rhodospirillaceae bacterium]|nr:baseplate J/gp47 family protein [Rhodospirillaceae bacterium]
MTLDATGLTIKRLSEIREEMFALAVSLIGAQIQLGVESVSAKFIELVAIQLAEIWELTQQLYFAFDPDLAEGQQLGNLASIIGVTREPATPSTTTLDFTGTPAVAIPQGSIYRVPNGARFITSVATVIGGGGTVSVAAESLETGPIEAPADSITEQETIIFGVDTVTNPTTAELGRNVETDQELRVR